MTRAAPTGGWIRRLARYLLAHRRNVTIALGAAIGGQAVAAFVPVVQKVVVDDVIVSQTRSLWPWLLLLLAAAIVSFVAAYLRRWVGGRVSLDVQFDLRNAIYERLQRLDFAGHDSLQTGQLVSRASSDLALVQGLLSFLPIMLGNLVMLVLSLIIMFVLSPALTAVMAVTLPLLLVLSFKLRRTIFPATWHAQQRAGEVAGVVDEAVTGVRVVKGFGQEDREVARLASTARGLYGSRLRLIRLQARYTPMLATVPALAQVAVLALGGWLAIEGHLTLGTFLAFSSYLVQLVAPVRMLASLMAIGQQARAGAERVLDILETNSAVQDRPGAEDLPALHGEVEFEGVRFGYTSEHPVLDGFDVRVRPGEVVALVGASGSGKSTVIALLPRFYDVGEGRVAIDGTDVRDVTLDSLRRQVGVVFEDAFLFSDTVRSNIAYGRPDATDADVQAAARAAGADGFIGDLPDGYETVVGERGLTLSGGQRQRVALARAILTDPRILILDDATSSVDAATEEAIHATLRELMAGRTTILIAHRRSTLRLAQRIVVVDRGRVVDEGSHDDLMVRSPLYRSLLAGPEDGAEGEETAPVVAATVTNGDGRGNGNGARRATTVVAGAQRFGPGANRNSVGGGPWGIALSATPELLAAVDRLPPIDDDPHVDDAVAAEAPVPGVRFRILRFVRPWWRWLVLGLALVVADAVLTLLGPFFIRFGIDHGVSAGDETALWLASAAFAVAVLLDWVVTWGYTLITGQTAERLLYALRVKIFAHLQRLSLDYYDREMAGRIMTRMTTDVDALSQLIQTGLINAVVGLLTCVGVFVFLIILSPPLALATAVVLPPLVVATWWYQRASSVAYARARDSIASVNANLQESLSGVRVAQAYVREDRNIAGFRGVNGEYLDARLGAQRLIALYFPFVLLLGDLGAIVVLGTGAALVAHGVVTAGIVIAFLLYLDQFFSPIQQLSQVFDTWQQAAASV
ncbi:MAG TPA: ABC transporter ATP-binding protein, partial [Acidimicrobiales bacterium]